MVDLNGIKSLIESHPVALATVTSGNKPNVIGVASVKVVAADKVLITDNYMDQTMKDIAGNRNVCLVVWDAEMRGCKLVGEAEYFTDGEWKRHVEGMAENRGLPAKGAILVAVSRIIRSK